MCLNVMLHGTNNDGSKLSDARDFVLVILVSIQVSQYPSSCSTVALAHTIMQIYNNTRIMQSLCLGVTVCASAHLCAKL